MVDIPTCHLQLKITSKTECPFLIIHENKAVYRKSIFSRFCTHFERFISSTYKLGTVYTLAYRYFQICSSWTKLHIVLDCLKQIFLKNSYPENFTKKCLGRFMDNIHVVKETNLKVGKSFLS